jgi:polyisoprenoid-binding protein YceI
MRYTLFLPLLVLLCTATGMAQHTTSYRIDPAQSTMQWHGYYMFSFGEHYGTIDIKKGTLSMAGDQLQGTFEIDMTSIRNLDMKNEEDGGKSLSDHLMNDDFFSSAKYPAATFTITKSEKVKDAKAGEPNYEITGNLTLKGKTNSLKFRAEVLAQGPKLTAKARFKFDRTKWDIQYGSDKFFGDVGDSAISDAVGIDLNLQGTAI